MAKHRRRKAGVVKKVFRAFKKEFSPVGAFKAAKRRVARRNYLG